MRNPFNNDASHSHAEPALNAAHALRLSVLSFMVASTGIIRESIPPEHD